MVMDHVLEYLGNSALVRCDLLNKWWQFPVQYRQFSIVAVRDEEGYPTVTLTPQHWHTIPDKELPVTNRVI